MKTRIDLGGICEMVVIDSRDDPTKPARIRDNAPHAHYALKRDDIKRELSAFRVVCDYMRPFDLSSVLEPFGGSGWHSALIQNIIRPARHIAWDRDGDCVESISQSLPNVQTDVCNSMMKLLEQSAKSIDWIHADYNLLTLELLAGDEKLRNSVHACFNVARKYLTLTETTPYSLDRHVLDWAREAGRWIKALSGWTQLRTVCWGPACMHVLASPFAMHTAGIKDEWHLIEVDNQMQITVLSEEA